MKFLKDTWGFQHAGFLIAHTLFYLLWINGLLLLWNRKSQTNLQPAESVTKMPNFFYQFFYDANEKMKRQTSNGKLFADLRHLHLLSEISVILDWKDSPLPSSASFTPSSDKTTTRKKSRKKMTQNHYRILCFFYFSFTTLFFCLHHLTVNGRSLYFL